MLRADVLTNECNRLTFEAGEALHKICMKSGLCFAPFGCTCLGVLFIVPSCAPNWQASAASLLTMEAEAEAARIFSVAEGAFNAAARVEDAVTAALVQGAKAATQGGCLGGHRDPSKQRRKELVGSRLSL